MIEPKEQFADVSVQRLAKVYAEALLNAAEAAQAVDAVLEEVDSLIDDVFRNDARLEALLAGAAVGRKIRQVAIEKAFANRSDKTFYKFLLVLNDHERLDLIRPIRRALHDLSDERARRLRVHAFSAVPLSQEFQDRIKAVAHDFFKLEPVLVLHVDPTLLGGLKLRIGDKVYDGTVRTRIDNLRNQLIERSSHEIQSRRDRFSSAE
ncbi:MAG: ATP synthase F1 subunit delta [Planctomycetes bacterium]|nr:ATP synthase F1 subunit delta [Planctomycetota bacterium]